MIQLIDQSDPTKLRYRCSECHQSVASSPSRSVDGHVWAPIPETPGLGRWSEHKCDPVQLAALVAKPAVAAKPRRSKPQPVAVPVAIPVKRRGRPRKTPAVE